MIYLKRHITAQKFVTGLNSIHAVLKYVAGTLKLMKAESRGTLLTLLWSVLALVPCYNLGSNIKVELKLLTRDKLASLMMQ